VSGPGREPVVVIGIGNEFRRDDGAGPAVVGRLRGLVPPGVELVITDGEPTRLIEAWFGRALALVVDAVRSEPSQPGRVHRFVLDRPGVGIARTASSHGFGLDDAIALAVALDRMPGRLIVHAIEAADLTQGTGLTPAVAEAVDVAVAAILVDIGAGRRLPAGRPLFPDLSPWSLVPAERDPRLWSTAAGRSALRVTGSKGSDQQCAHRIEVKG
jgi:hydrogenase maturation protease